MMLNRNENILLKKGGNGNNLPNTKKGDFPNRIKGIYNIKKTLL